MRFDLNFLLAIKKKPAAVAAGSIVDYVEI
jgi:hypothetical protein